MATVADWKPDAASSQYGCKAGVKSDPTMGKPPGRGSAARVGGENAQTPPAPYDITEAHAGRRQAGPGPTPIPVWTLGPTDATHGGVQRRGAARPEIEARQKGPFFRGSQWRTRYD